MFIVIEDGGIFGGVLEPYVVWCRLTKLRGHANNNSKQCTVGTDIVIANEPAERRREAGEAAAL